ncbi:hypothetical protein TNCT_189531 [Trichonephila clavata]|uniref:Uncharacterized protein n=1 Tax=Trichonephila clavata TaxID=2740835 RepID=A0A8X6LIB1_TRICU|nr:hypothetical protein TNCT_189531 [Trichonephila clavata]
MAPNRTSCFDNKAKAQSQNGGRIAFAALLAMNTIKGKLFPSAMERGLCVLLKYVSPPRMRHSNLLFLQCHFKDKIARKAHSEEEKKIKKKISKALP